MGSGVHSFVPCFMLRHLIGFHCKKPLSVSLSFSTLLYSRRQYGKRNHANSCWFSCQAESSLQYEIDRPYDDKKYMEKTAALQVALSRLVGDFSKDSMLSLHHFFCKRCVPVISTGSLRLDHALGIGGLPKGRMVEIYGQEASGKTTLALHIVKEVQKLGGCCAFFDVESALDPSFAEAIGINTDNLLIARANSAENLLSAADTLIKSGAADVLVIDTVAALVSQHELDNVVGGSDLDIQSRLMMQALRKINYSLIRSQTLLILVNQIRTKVGSSEVFGPSGEVTCGGNALKFHSAIRLRITRKNLIVTEDGISGIGVTVQVVKNKLAPAMKKAELYIQFGKGIFQEHEVFEMACDHGLISSHENGYMINGLALRNKMEAVQYLVQNNSVLDKLIASLRATCFE